MTRLKHRLGTRFAAGILCAAVALSSSNLQALASDSATSDISQEETDISASVSSVTSEDSETTADLAESTSADDIGSAASEQQSDLSEDAGDTDLSAASVDEDVAGTESDSGSSGETEVTGADAVADTEESSADAETHTITGFVGLSDSESSVTYYYDEKPTEAEVIADLPTTLEVYLDGESESTEIPVTWESPADYDNSEFYWYEFDPVWDEEIYTLDCEEAVPYINVNLTVLTVSAASVTSNNNETIIFDYLINTAGFSVAAACGILANIYSESAFNCNAKGDYNSNGDYTSYGLCQWHGSRFTSLKEYCSSNGLDYTTVEGQLAYLMYELQTSTYKTKVYDRLMSVSDDADGAYWAAYYWCYYYEIPANYKSVSETRGNLAMNTFWPEYQEYAGTTSDTLTISGVVAPTSITAGSSFTIEGTITSSQTITKVTAAIYNTSGDTETSSSDTPNTKTYSLKNSTVDNNLKFGSLDAGVYTYKVKVTTSAGTTTLVDQDFVVLSTEKTVSNGYYYIYTKVNTSYSASIEDSSSSSGANVQLAKTDTDDSYMMFQFTYQKNGYYTIKNVGSGMYLAISGTSSGSNVKQSSSKAYWYVLPDGTGSYYLVPTKATTMCLYLKNGTASAGQNIQIHTAEVIKSQRWKLSTAYTPATISGATKPGTLTAGNSFSIKGTISSTSKITSVTVAVYDTSGDKQIGKTVKPNAKSYSLSNVDASIKFGTLSAGVYRYKVTAKNSYGTTTLVNKVFVVLSTGKTVANGTYYYITSKVNTTYCLGIKSSSSSSGANVQLAKKSSSTEYQKFKFIYQSNGYYKIKDVGSGKYLAISEKSSGANVKQSSTATLWQVLPDGTGSYYLVPKGATTCCLYLNGGSASSGTNVKIKTASISKSQRWKLSTAYTPATISGATKPGTLTAGNSFSIKGTISSTSKITSVTVAVYDTSGDKQIGKTVKPNAKSYSLSNVDASIKFGTLSAGVYRYKVTAKNSYGTTTLVNKVFVVLSTGKTVANGTYYYITSKVNTTYCLGIKSSSSSSGANVQLAKKSSSTEYQKFKFIYQSNGYYKIKDVGSGKYLAISEKSSGANVKQSSTATLWQVLPDGTGSYYLVPKGATTCCLYLNGGSASSGTNVKIKTASISKSQRWKLSKTYKAPTISGATKPGTLSVGSSFTIKGKISSETKITSVTVAVYDSDGNKKIGKTVSPNAKTYDLSKVDSSIKFGTLSKGTYTYKVTATNSAGKKTLISKSFKVK
ncbi:MAG: phage tail tip lysozyme [Clostridiales bacterium]|nr:phage tail tip lysozyme [Clostridiales bacterium]